MENNWVDLIDKSHSVGKHEAMLKQCVYYIQILNSQVVLEELFQAAYRFAMDSYAEVQKDDIMVALANTSPLKRNVDVMTDLNMNL